MNYKILLLFFSLAFVPVSHLLGKGSDVFQNALPPQVGKPCPEFVLTNVTHYAKKRVTSEELKGKWLLLDFWFTGCSTCITSFPKLNGLYREFKNDMHLFLIGKNDKKYNSNIEEVFEKLRKKQNLEIPAAYDTALFGLWSISSMPKIILVDPEGIVRYITDGRDITTEKIRTLLANQPVSFHPKHLDLSVPSPGKISGLSKNDDKLLYRSVLTKWDGEQQNSGYDINDYASANPNNLESLKEGWTATMVPLFQLYNYAYFGRSQWTWRNADYYGKIYHEPILELKDTSEFIFDFRFDVGKGTYCYNLTIPPKMVSKEYLMNLFQSDLKRAFGYNVVYETRQMPVWRLVADPAAKRKLITKGGDPENGFMDPKTGNIQGIAAGFTCKNQTVSHVLRLITSIVEQKDNTPFLDETGIKENIDIIIDADLTDFSDIRKALRKNGLNLVRGTTAMQVIVIKDRK